jgi:hypothetical protein
MPGERMLRSTANIHFIRSPMPRTAVLDASYRRLRDRRFVLSESIPDLEAPDADQVPGHDLYVLVACSPLAVSIATVLYRSGARVGAISTTGSPSSPAGRSRRSPGAAVASSA